MYIVCATDNNFVQHCSIMLVSLLSNNHDVTIYILTEGLSEESRRIINDEVEQYGGKVNFCTVDSSVVERFPMPKAKELSHISRATYYRLFIPELLPRNIDKAIYLDCDIIVNGSLDDLWNTPIDNYALGACLQIGSGYEAIRLGYPIEYGYFNAGVNVINLKYWRENNVSAHLIDYIATNYERIKYHDQDTLNAVLYDKTIHIQPKWNMTSIAYACDLDKRGDSINGRVVNKYTEEKNCIKDYKNNPTVLHYVAKPKPWQKDCVHPLYQMYYDYAKKTLHYNNIKPQNPISRYMAITKYKIRQILSSIKQRIKKTDKTRI